MKKRAIGGKSNAYSTLRHVEVRNLFGSHNVSVSFRDDNAISALIGSNGSGKTTIMKLVESVASGSFLYLFLVKFDFFNVDFSDNKRIIAFRDATKQQEDNDVISLAAFAGSEQVAEFHLDYAALLKAFDEFDFDSARRRSEGRRFYTHRSPLEKLQILYDSYDENLPSFAAMNDDFNNFLNNIYITFIGTSRTYRASKALTRGAIPYRITRDIYPSDYAVDYISFAMRDQIGRELRKYANYSQDLDRSFPIRLLGDIGKNIDTNYESIRNLSEVTQRLYDEYSKLGLLSETESSFPQVSEIVDSKASGLLHLYLQDLFNKLSTLSKISNKLNLFLHICNSSLERKKISFNPDLGLECIGFVGQIPISRLSQGEQHLIVMLYHFIFAVPEGSIVFLDEPELSLNVEWKISFIANMRKVMDLNPFQLIMASHSPTLLDPYYDEVAVDMMKGN